MIEKLYNDKLRNLIVKRYSFMGSVPNNEIVNANLNEIKEIYPFIGKRSMAGQVSRKVLPNQEVTLEAFNELIGLAQIDIDVIREGINQNYKKITESYNSWLSSFEMIKSRYDSLESELDELLHLEENSEGYLDFIIEDFSELSSIDLNKTDANINTSSNSVSLGNNDLIREEFLTLEDGSISFSTMNSQGSSLFFDYEGNPSDILENSEEGILGHIKSTKNQKVSLILNIKFAETKSASRIDILNSIGQFDSSYVEVYYSPNRVDFLPFGERQANFKRINFISEEREFLELRVILTKEQADLLNSDNTYSYFFGITGISIPLNKFQFLENSILTTKAYEVNPFRKASIEVCDVNTDETNISYSLSVDSENWIDINPINSAPSSLPFLTSFSLDYELTNIDSNNLVDENKSSISLLSSNEHVPFKRNFVFLNFFIEDTLENKNITKDGFLLIDYTNEMSQSEIIGWEESGNKLITYIKNNNDTDTEIDIGPNTISINDTLKSGKVLIEKNKWHKIEIDKYLYSFSISTDANSESDMKDIDPLYPYNLKYIIEGFPYSENFEGRQIYSGFDERGRKFLPLKKNISEAKLSDEESWCWVDIEKDGKFIKIPFIKIRNNANTVNKNALLAVSSSESLFSKIYLRAKLATNNLNISPILKEVTIRTGV